MRSKATLQTLTAKPPMYYAQSRSEMLRYVPTNCRRLLDVGCANGRFGNLVNQSSGAEVWGVEPDSDAAAEAARTFHKVVHVDAISALPLLPESYFDCISFNDVLEHMEDPFSLLAAVRSKLSGSGVVICSVPNVRYFTVLYRLLVEKNWRYSDSGVMDKTHLRFFTLRSLVYAMESAGYEILQIEGINATHHWAARLLRVASLGWLNDTVYPQIACVARPAVQ